MSKLQKSLRILPSTCCIEPSDAKPCRTTNLMIKLVPLLTDCMHLVNQDLLHCTITKQALCIAEYEYVGNPHIDLLDELSPVLKNNSLHTLVLTYHHKCKKTFLSLDQDHSTGQVIITYLWKYREDANGPVHHLVKYMVSWPSIGSTMLVFLLLKKQTGRMAHSQV